MILIQTCPECGHDLIDVMLASNPPIPKKECPHCGWSWTGAPRNIEEVRVPFKPPEDYKLDTPFVNQMLCVNCPTNPANGGDGLCACTLGQIPIT